MRATQVISVAVASFALLALSAPATAAGPETLKLDINAHCMNGVAMFEIVNKGERWPDSAMFNVYRAVDRTLLNSRRLRMAKDQQASFRISKGTKPGEELAIYIEPGWYKRQFRFDGKIVCR